MPCSPDTHVYVHTLYEKRTGPLLDQSQALCHCMSPLQGLVCIPTPVAPALTAVNLGLTCQVSYIAKPLTSIVQLIPTTLSAQHLLAELEGLAGGLPPCLAPHFGPGLLHDELPSSQRLPCPTAQQTDAAGTPRHKASSTTCKTTSNSLSRKIACKQPCDLLPGTRKQMGCKDHCCGWQTRTSQGVLPGVLPHACQTP